jgi:hypothetical protein
MSSPVDPELLSLLYSALRAEIGISVATDNVERLRNKLYAARKSLMDPDLELLFLAPDPDRPSTHLFIAKKRITLEGAPDAENS